MLSMGWVAVTSTAVSVEASAIATSMVAYCWTCSVNRELRSTSVAVIVAPGITA